MQGSTDIFQRHFKINKKEWQKLITICDNLPETIKFSLLFVVSGFAVYMLTVANHHAWSA